VTAAFLFGVLLSSSMMSQIHEPQELYGRMTPRGEKDAMF